MTDDVLNQPFDVLPGWIERQTLKSTPTPGYEPAEHRGALAIIGERLLADNTIAGGKMSASLGAILSNPAM